jgi:hypothetical protein
MLTPALVQDLALVPAWVLVLVLAPVLVLVMQLVVAASSDSYSALS